MSCCFLSNLVRRTCPSPASVNPLTTVVCVKRRASLNSAIGRGLRKSKGVGFRSKEKPGHADRSPVSALVRRTADIKIDKERISLTRQGWRNERSESFDRQKAAVGSNGESATTTNRERSSQKLRSSSMRDDRRHGASTRGLKAVSPTMSARKDSPQTRHPELHDGSTSKPGWESRRNSGTSGAVRNPRLKGAWQAPNEGGRNASNIYRRSSASFDDARDRASSTYDAHHAGGSRMTDAGGREREMRNTPSTAEKPHVRRYLKADSKNATEDFDNGGFNRQSSDLGVAAKVQSTADKAQLSAFDNRMPVSVPHTTPASEFLYGTSVVEAALHSQRDPRRVLYKLYTYVGEKRDDSHKDASIQRSARKNGLEIVRVSRDGLRMLDKMSAGRPHNGYILEASPLPRLPILSLGEYSDEDGQIGFRVKLDHQTREEIAVNGNSDFVRTPKNFSGRKPFVLFLDGILDPGNLGSIIRTAAFLGVSGVAISTRNSASFSPIVLKASAGASEAVTLFAVARPASFVADSRSSGWRVYAAVAPSKDSKSSTPFLTSDRLDDPLSSTPCILMFGGEGDGLRWNLRSKADVELAIRGSSQRGAVDSLNVGVAAGILCDAFLSGKSGIVKPNTTKILQDATMEADLF